LPNENLKFATLGDFSVQGARQYWYEISLGRCAIGANGVPRSCVSVSRVGSVALSIEVRSNVVLGGTTPIRVLHTTRTAASSKGGSKQHGDGYCCRAVFPRNAGRFGEMLVHQSITRAQWAISLDRDQIRPEHVLTGPDRPKAVVVG